MSFKRKGNFVSIVANTHSPKGLLILKIYCFNVHCILNSEFYVYFMYCILTLEGFFFPIFFLDLYMEFYSSLGFIIIQKLKDNGDHIHVV